MSTRAQRKAYAARQQASRNEFLWREGVRREAQLQRDFHRDAAAADDIRDKTSEKVKAIYVKAETDAQRAIERIEKAFGAEEKKILSAPRIALTGATKNLTNDLIVSHWKAVLPQHLADRIGWGDRDSGPLLVLREGGGLAKTDSVADLLAAEDPSLISDEDFIEWVQRVSEIWDTEVSRRYQVLGQLRNDDRFAEFAEAAGLVDVKSAAEEMRGTYGTYSRPVSLHRIPSIKRVSIEQDGLRIAFAHDPKASAKGWAARIDLIRNGWRAMGMDAPHLRLLDDSDGGVVMSFDDAPSSFPAAVCVEPPSSVAMSKADAIERYEGAAWSLGVDARGNTIQFPVEDFPHVLVVGGTGAGKSVWARSIIEMFRTGYRDPRTGRDTAGGFTCFVSSGKVTDFVTLSKLPGVAMVAGDAAQTAVMVRAVKEEAVRRYDEAAEAKLSGSHRAFDYQPIVLFLDEWGATWLAMDSQYKNAKSFESDIDWILRVGREARVHVVLLSQTIRKTGPGAVPGSWQANLGLTISLGKPEAETLNNAAVFPSESRERAELVGNRIAGKKGRGMAVLQGAVTEFQSYYVWSPGTTSLSPDADKKVRPPTDEVRALWERWEPVSAQVPWLTPRLGLRVSSPDWSTGSDAKTKTTLEEVSSTPVIPITDREGRPIPGREQFDPWSPEWAGKAGNQSRTAVLEFEDSGTKSAYTSHPDPADEPSPRGRDSQTDEFDAPTHGEPATSGNPETAASGLDITSLSIEEREALLRQLLSIPVTEMESAPDSAPARKAAPKPAPTLKSPSPEGW